MWKSLSAINCLLNRCKVAGSILRHTQLRCIAGMENRMIPDNPFIVSFQL